MIGSIAVKEAVKYPSLFVMLHKGIYTFIYICDTKVFTENT